MKPPFPSHSVSRMDPASGFGYLDMQGVGTYFRLAGVDFRCKFTVSWINWETLSQQPGCECDIWSKQLRTKNGNSLAVDCPCLGPWKAPQNLPQTTTYTTSDVVGRL